MQEGLPTLYFRINALLLSSSTFLIEDPELFFSFPSRGQRPWIPAKNFRE